MATTEEGFRELLYGEVYMDMERMRDLALHGVPSSVRPQVWKYLLGVSRPDPSEAMQLSKFQAQEFEQSLYKSDCSRIIARPLQRFASTRASCCKQNTLGKNSMQTNEEVVAALEKIVVAFLNNNPHAEFNQGMFSLIMPFLFAMKETHDSYLCFESLMKIIDHHYSENPFTHTVAYFLTCFRSVLPELYNYFEEEELDAAEWVVSWLGLLLANALPLNCVLRLWDTYFAHENPLHLHIYVCLAILMELQEDLMELDHFEIKSYLQRLPSMDIDKIITQAYNVQAEIGRGHILV